MKLFNRKKILILKSLSFLFLLFKPFFKKKFEANSEIKNILLIDLHLIGDIVLLTPVIETLKLKFKGSKIFLLAGPWSTIILKEYIDDQFRIIEYSAPWVKNNKKNIFINSFDFYKCFLRLKKYKWDMGIDMRGDIRNSFILYSLNVNHRIGYDLMHNGILLNDIVVSNSKLIHLVDFHKNILLHLNLISHDFVYKPDLKIYNNKKPLINNTIGIHFGASTLNRVPNFELIVSWLDDIMQLNPKNTKYLVFITPENGTISHFIYTYFYEKDYDIKEWFGDLDLFIIKISECTKLFLLDSGPAHIASALGVSSVVIFGPSDPFATSPVGKNVNKIFKNNSELECWPCSSKTCINKNFQICYPKNILS
jgi:ADP-heptose:LPS heptosyltransferase